VTMGTVTFTIPAFSHGVHTSRVLSVQFVIDEAGQKITHEFNVGSLFMAEANNYRHPGHTERVASHLRGIANDLDAAAVHWKPPTFENPVSDPPEPHK